MLLTGLVLCLQCLSYAAPRRVAPAVPDYLPLAPGEKWVLRSPHESAPVVFEVVAKTGAGYEIQSTTPWGSSHWTLVQDGQKYYMTNYDSMPLPPGVLYLDFNAQKGHQWKNQIGTMKVVTRSATVKTAQKVYRDGITIHQSSGNVTAIYAPGVGYVQFGSGSSAFVLDEAASNLGGGPTRSSAVPAPAPPSQTVAGPRNLPRVGIIPTVFANQPQTPANQIAAYEKTLGAGINFMAC
ncbi:MAG: hypothetical protein ACRD3O_20230, partial [Terriglobia bacterium]